MLLILILAAGAVIMLGSKQSTPDNKAAESASKEPTATAMVEITKDGFMPNTLSVKPGTAVTWINQDDKPHHIASNPHPTHTNLSGLDSGQEIGTGDSYSFTFSQPSTFSYHDHLDPAINGTIVVQ